jgi:hypothetical protein
MTPPLIKTIGNISVSIYFDGHPHWSQIRWGDQTFRLSPEELRDLHYATGRLIAALEDHESAELRKLGIRP